MAKSPGSKGRTKAPDVPPKGPEPSNNSSKVQQEVDMKREKALKGLAKNPDKTTTSKDPKGMMDNLMDLKAKWEALNGKHDQDSEDSTSEDSTSEDGSKDDSEEEDRPNLSKKSQGPTSKRGSLPANNPPKRRKTTPTSYNNSGTIGGTPVNPTPARGEHRPISQGGRADIQPKVEDDDEPLNHGQPHIPGQTTRPAGHRGPKDGSGNNPSGMPPMEELIMSSGDQRVPREVGTLAQGQANQSVPTEPTKSRVLVQGQPLFDSRVIPGTNLRQVDVVFVENGPWSAKLSMGGEWWEVFGSGDRSPSRTRSMVESPMVGQSPWVSKGPSTLGQGSGPSSLAKEPTQRQSEVPRSTITLESSEPMTIQRSVGQVIIRFNETKSWQIQQMEDGEEVEYARGGRG
ncbi:MAG: hypothetical protein M1823_003733 [Watsoniomyces obsoletus]|nr:MAG: hypothetical protein M1823_003733 [Watsoniomyces obsoletus]